MPIKTTLTRQQMVAAIQAGGSVQLGGRLYTKVEQLPTEAELAQGDPAKEAAAREVLLARKRAIDAELAALDQPGSLGPALVTNPDLQDDAATAKARAKAEAKARAEAEAREKAEAEANKGTK